MDLARNCRPLLAAVTGMMAALFFAVGASGQTVVNVALPTGQPPMVIEKSAKRGLVFDVVDALNSMQGEFRFQVDDYPAERLMVSYDEMDVHIIAYSDAKWGWGDRGARPSLNLTNGRDLFFTLGGYERDPSVTEEIAAVRGFHYAFANYDSDLLSQMPNVTLVSDEESVLRLVENKRVDKGIVSEAFLQWIALSKPEVYARLKIDFDRPDHSYNRQILVLPNSPVSVDQINDLIWKMIASGRLQSLYARYGLHVPDALNKSRSNTLDPVRYFSSLMTMDAAAQGNAW